MDRKKLLITISIIILLIIGGVIVYWYYQSITSDEPTPTPEQEVVDQGPGALPEFGTTEPATEAPEQTGDVPEDSALIATTYYFVERWGTYSNLSNYQNIDDLRPVMTEELFARATAQRRETTYADLDELAYEAYDTEVTKISWEEQTDISATARVTTRRYRITEDTEEPYSQDVLLRFVKQNDKWLVNEAIWQQ